MSDAATSLYVDSQLMSWADDALCQGKSDLFFAPFAERPEARVRREAKAAELCAACPAAFTCKQHARDHRELGFWGGESEAERATRVGLPLRLLGPADEARPLLGARLEAAKAAPVGDDGLSGHMPGQVGCQEDSYGAHIFRWVTDATQWCAGFQSIN